MGKRHNLGTPTKEDDPRGTTTSQIALTMANPYAFVAGDLDTWEETVLWNKDRDAHLEHPTIIRIVNNGSHLVQMINRRDGTHLLTSKVTGINGLLKHPIQDNRWPGILLLAHGWR